MYVLGGAGFERQTAQPCGQARATVHAAAGRAEFQFARELGGVHIQTPRRALAASADRQAIPLPPAPEQLLGLQLERGGQIGTFAPGLGVRRGYQLVDHPRPLFHIQHGGVDLQLQALCRQRRRRIGPIAQGHRAAQQACLRAAGVALQQHLGNAAQAHADGVIALRGLSTRLAAGPIQTQGQHRRCSLAKRRGQSQRHALQVTADLNLRRTRAPAQVCAVSGLSLEQGNGRRPRGQILGLFQSLAGQRALHPHPVLATLPRRIRELQRAIQSHITAQSAGLQTAQVDAVLRKPERAAYARNAGGVRAVLKVVSGQRKIALYGSLVGIVQRNLQVHFVRGTAAHTAARQRIAHQRTHRRSVHHGQCVGQGAAALQIQGHGGLVIQLANPGGAARDGHDRAGAARMHPVRAGVAQGQRIPVQRQVTV